MLEDAWERKYKLDNLEVISLCRLILHCHHLSISIHTAIEAALSRPSLADGTWN